MSSNNDNAEDLARIEHKLDLIIDCLASSDPGFSLRSVGDPDHLCPLCLTQVTYYVDIINKRMKRACECSTNIQAPLDLEPFTPPTENNNGPREED